MKIFYSSLLGLLDRINLFGKGNTLNYLDFCMIYRELVELYIDTVNNSFQISTI